MQDKIFTKSENLEEKANEGFKNRENFHDEFEKKYDEDYFDETSQDDESHNAERYAKKTNIFTTENDENHNTERKTRTTNIFNTDE